VIIPQKSHSGWYSFQGADHPSERGSGLYGQFKEGFNGFAKVTIAPPKRIIPHEKVSTLIDFWIE
jgi:hypothetical protein